MSFQTPWKPRLRASPTDELPEQLEANEGVTRSSRLHANKFPDNENDGWKATLVSAEDTAAPTANFVSNSASLSFDGDDDWKSVNTAQPPSHKVHPNLFVEAVAGDKRPHFEAWIHRERATSTTTETTSTRYNKSYRRPYSSARRTEEPKVPQSLSDNGDRSANLRSILKQNGGMSLSEILQQKNLSLDDLLKGKQTAIKALQNTASPPVESREEGNMEKSTRRLPAMGQPVVRRHPSNVASRGNTQLSDLNADSIHSGKYDENIDSSEFLSAEKKSVSTIPTFLADTSATTNGKYGRSPPSRKPIKEVVSAIRPDLNNSNLRKRLPIMKSLHAKQPPSMSSTVESRMFESSVPINENVPTNETVVVLEPSVSPEYVDATKAMAATTTTTTEEPKPTIRERIPFRPMRPRSSLQRMFNITESPIAMIEPSTAKIVMTTEGLPPFTGPSSTTQASDQYTIVENTVLPIEHEHIPFHELNVRLNNSAPELNLVDLEDESKAKEVTSLEDLFLDEPMDDSGNNAESSNEFIHLSSTSRSDTVPNSLKIFGGNLVNIFKKTLDKLDVTERNPTLFTDITSRFIDDKTEIMDLLSDRRSGARLVKVLKQRNMTIDELIDHRKRGSSQLHLAEIFFNRTRSLPTSTLPPQTDPINQTKLDVVTAFKNFPDFNLESVRSVNPDEIKTDSQGESYFTSVINVQPTAEVAKEGRAMQKPFSVKLMESATKTNIPTQLWHTDSSVDTNFLENASPGIASMHSLRPSTGDEISANGFHEIIDQNRNDAAARYRDPLDLELTGHGYRRNSVLIENAQQAPMGVRSAIVASASIVLISLTIFIIIFLVCRWRQKRKRKICYTDRFQAIRGRLPILGSRDASPSKQSSSPPMAYIGGANNSRRSSKLNTMDPNSPEVQEYLYDAMRKPFQ